MKKYLFSIIVFLTVSNFSFAQDVSAAKKTQFQWSKEIMTELGISEDVQAKIEVVKKASNGEIRKVREDMSLAEDVKKQTLKELNAKRQKDIEALLTPEQKEKAAAMRKEINSKG